MKTKVNFKVFSLAKILFLLLIVSLSLMQPSAFRLFSYEIRFTEIIFLFTIFFWLIALFFKQTRLRFSQFYYLLGFYLLTMIFSTLFSVNPKQSAAKLSGEIYLFGLAFLTFNLVENTRMLKQTVFAWLGGTCIAVFVGVLTIVLFYIDRDNSLLTYTLSIYGAVPVGNYPRITSTFISASLLCNYLSVSLVMLFVAEKKGWLRSYTFQFFYFSILLTAVFTLSSSLGGIALLLGIWFWYLFRGTKKYFARLSLFGGIFIASFYLFISFIALKYHPTAPFSINLPLIETSVYPSSRFMVWIDSFNTFTQNFWFGRGVGQPSCRVLFLNYDGFYSLLTDAHNIYLSVASQNGIFGLIAILAIAAYFLRKIIPVILLMENRNLPYAAFGIAFITAFVYQGIFASFEDARHLWILKGLILAAESFENKAS